MASVFTEHVRHFNSASDPAERVLPELEKLLRRCMRWRGLLALPPSYLGYTHGSWFSPGAFDEIVSDCYDFAVLQRLKALRKQLRIRDKIDGLITRNVKNFLLERQRANDKLGYAVFRNVEAAVRRAQAAGELAIERRNEGRLADASLLRFDPLKGRAAAIDAQRLEEELNEPASLADVARLSAIGEEGESWATAFLHRLREQGVAAVRFGDLKSVLVARTRVARPSAHPVGQAAMDDEGDRDLAELVAIVQPDPGLDERDRWEHLKLEVPRRIGRLDRQERVRERLMEVFECLVKLIDEGGASPPTQAELMGRMAIARATLSDDFRILRGVLEESLSDENPDA